MGKWKRYGKHLQQIFVLLEELCPVSVRNYGDSSN